jgi:hypothetical protein
MTLDRSTTLPPDLAETLLEASLSADDRESVTGDLLEEYRESIVPAMGARADRWYIRQVSWYVLRAVMPWALVIAVICIGRFVIDALVPVTYTRGVVNLRSAIMSRALLATFAIGGGRHAWRSQRFGSGVLVAFATAVIGGIASLGGTLVFLSIRHDPDTLRAIAGSGGLGEALWGMPILLILFGTTAGTVGALVGRACVEVYSRAKTKSA